MFKQARKIIMGASLALVLGLSYIGVSAQEDLGVKNQETDFNITVTESSIEEPGEGGDGGEGNPESVKGKLAIWLKPTKMDFVGKYNELIKYDLNLVKEGDLNHRRLAIADVRANEIGWSLKAQLTDLVEVDHDGEKVNTISSGYKMSMIPTVGTYKIDEDGKVIRDDIDYENKNGVKAITQDGRIVITKNESMILQAKSDDDTERVGKGYTAAQLDDIKMNFDAAAGFAGKFKGQVKWKLSNIPN